MKQVSVCVISALFLVAAIACAQEFVAWRDPSPHRAEMAGGELTTLGNQHGDRLAGLVFLDALGDPRDWPASDPAYMALMQKLPPAPAGAACTNDRTSFGHYRASLQCSMKFTFPEAELRNTYVANPDGSVGRFKTPRR